ncbi:hypothetical protein SRHO_G00236310 [Serrasalmus rhombeus]
MFPHLEWQTETKLKFVITSSCAVRMEVFVTNTSAASVQRVSPGFCANGSSARVNPARILTLARSATASSPVVSFWSFCWCLFPPCWTPGTYHHSEKIKVTVIMSSNSKNEPRIVRHLGWYDGLVGLLY